MAGGDPFKLGKAVGPLAKVIDKVGFAYAPTINHSKASRQRRPGALRNSLLVVFGDGHEDVNCQPVG